MERVLRSFTVAPWRQSEANAPPGSCGPAEVAVFVIAAATGQVDGEALQPFLLMRHRIGRCGTTLGPRQRCGLGLWLGCALHRLGNAAALVTLEECGGLLQFLRPFREGIGRRGNLLGSARVLLGYLVELLDGYLALRHCGLLNCLKNYLFLNQQSCSQEIFDF